MIEDNFIEELLAEVDQQDTQALYARMDLLLGEIKAMQDKIANNFKQAEQECKIINEWALRKNAQMQDKVEFIEKKLEAFIKAEQKKTIELANGTLRYRKCQPKIEIADLELFLKKATSEMITTTPENIKPDLTKIKKFIAIHKYKPDGINLIEGTEQFSYKLNNGDNDGTEEETGFESEPANNN